MKFSYKKNLLISSRIADLGLYKGSDSNWLKSRRTASVTSVLVLKAAEGLLLGYGSALILKKLANDFEYTRDFFDKFPKIKNYINSPNFVYYAATTVAVLMIITCLSVYFAQNRGETGKSEDKVESLRLVAAKTSPSIQSLTFLFTLLQSSYSKLRSCFDADNKQGKAYSSVPDPSQDDASQKNSKATNANGTQKPATRLTETIDVATQENGNVQNL